MSHQLSDSSSYYSTSSSEEEVLPVAPVPSGKPEVDISENVLPVQSKWKNLNFREFGRKFCPKFSEKNPKISNRITESIKNIGKNITGNNRK
jgi:hypothetical protein